MSATNGNGNGLELYTVKEAGDLLKVTPPTVYRLIKSGVIPAVRIGGNLRIHRADLEAAAGGNGAS